MMKRLVSFFEILADDFNRAVHFYEQVFNVKLEIMDCDNEKMAFFPAEEGECPGAISWTSDTSFKPGKGGVLMSLYCENMEQALEKISANKGTILIPKTKIESENRGYFAVFTDSENNRLGLYSED